MKEVSIDSATHAVDCLETHHNTIETVGRNGEVSVPHPWCDLLLPWILPPEILELLRQADAGSDIQVDIEEIDAT